MIVIVPIVIKGKTVFMAKKGSKRAIDSTPAKAKARLLNEN